VFPLSQSKHSSPYAAKRALPLFFVIAVYIPKETGGETYFSKMVSGLKIGCQGITTIELNEKRRDVK
jgi:hypothetical protein